MKRLPKNKRHIAPALITAGMGIISSVQQQQQVNKDREAMLGEMFKSKASQDALYLEDYPVEGTNVNYYANGGELATSTIKGKYKTIGGDLQTIADGVEVAKGNTHGEKSIDGEYGITLIDGNQPVAEIEDEEVLVDNEKVFSDRLMYDKKHTFADKMKKVASKSAKIEKKLGKTTDVKSRNGYERQLAGMKMAEEVLFDQQELVKGEEGKKELAMLARGGYVPSKNSILMPEDEEDLGFDYKDFNQKLAPTLIDNIGNAVLTATAPKIPKPLPIRSAQLESNVNVNPELSAIINNDEVVTDNILNNTSNSNVARSNISSSKLNSLRSKLGVLSAKESTERGIRNTNLEGAVNAANANTAQANQYNATNFDRTNDIIGRASANIGNLSSDIDNTLTRMDKDQYYDEIQFLDLLDDPSGEKARTVKKNGYAKMSPRQKRLFDAEQQRKNQ